jgi:hypothetical protein
MTDGMRQGASVIRWLESTGAPHRSHRWAAFKIALLLELPHYCLPQNKSTGVWSGAGAIVMNRRKKAGGIIFDCALGNLVCYVGVSISGWGLSDRSSARRASDEASCGGATKA